MQGMSWDLTIGITVGLSVGLFLAITAFICIWWRRPGPHVRSSSSRRASTVPFCANGVDGHTDASESSAGDDSPRSSDAHATSIWVDGLPKKNPISASGIPKYLFKEVQKATNNFTTLIGQGAYGAVYKSQMSTGELLAVKVLSSSSKQGDKEFQNEVVLLGRLHHRNLVNLVGYCTEKGQRLLLYPYMPNGSLFTHLYGENHSPLKWELRVSIALEVARGLEYLHDGAVPPVVHRDIKSSNILLDHNMRARVADFGLSREEMVTRHATNIRGTFGYLDPEYVSSRSFTKKSDVYSYGVLLFELVTGRNPQQGLMEYVELAAISADGKSGWEEIADSRLNGAFDVEELNDLAAVAYKCVSRVSRKRPSMRDVVQALSRILKHNRIGRNSSSRELLPTLTSAEGQLSADLEMSEQRSSFSGHGREESVGSIADLPV